MRRKWYRKVRRIRRNFDPVILGQTKAGFILAAALVAFWLVGTEAHAALDNPGSAENQYFKLEWSYDLAHGNGNFILGIKNPAEGNIYDNIKINAFRFNTLGRHITSIQEATGIPTTFYPPTIFEIANQHYNDIVVFPSVQFHADSQTHLQFNMTFQTTGVALLPTQICVSGYHTMVPALVMDFLTVQTIPEPTSVTNLFLGAVGAIAGLWRKAGL
jgi:hypothetical protein